MRASVVVLNFNSGEKVERCIGDLLCQVAVDEFEVLLVDNASTDGSCEIVERRHGADPRLRIHRSSRNLGCAGGRNRGLELARGEVISFVDSDSFAGPDWLAAVLDAASLPEVGLVACRQVYARNPRILNGLGGAMNLQGYAWDLAFGEPVDFTPLPLRGLFSCGNGLTVKRTVVERIGGFDDVYMNYYEDVEFCLRARRSGFTLALAPDAVLEHWMGSSDAVNRNKIFLCERNRIRTVLKHYPMRWLLRWFLKEMQFEKSTDDVVGRSLRVLVWLWTLGRLGGLVRWRLGQGLRLPQFDVEGLVEPYWGHGRHRGYNLALEPDLDALSGEIVIGESGEPGLLFGWYEVESGSDPKFRWSDGLAACALRASAPVRCLRLEFCWPDAESAAGGAALYIVCPTLGTVNAAELPFVAAFEWQSIDVELGETGGAVELVIQTLQPFVSRSLFSERSIGIGVRSLKLI